MTRNTETESDTMQLPRLRIEWRVNIVTLGAVLLSMATGGTMVYAQVIAMNADVAALKLSVASQAEDQNDQIGRVIRLETRMDLIIDQNKEILTELRGGRPRN